jgi:DNA polymerase-1
MGDQSDNIPGLPGVGEVTAKKLIHEFGSIENLILNVKDVTKEKLRINIEENAHLAVMSKMLATIHLNVPIEIKFEEFFNEEPDYNELINIYIKLEFNSFLKRLKMNNSEVSTGEKLSFDNNLNKTIIVNNLEQLDNIIDENEIVLKVFTDNNHKDIPLIEGISFTTEKGNFYLKGSDDYLINKFTYLLIEHKSKIVGHNLINDYYSLLTRIDDEMIIAGMDFLFNTSFDTSLAQYVLDSSRSNYEIKTLIFEYFHEEIESENDFNKAVGQLDLFNDSSERFSAYGRDWCQAVINLKNILEGKISDENLGQILYTVELPLIEVLASMEVNGFAVNKQELVNIGEELASRLDLLTDAIYNLAGETFNINSPAQLGFVLFEKLGLATGKKTKTGFSTGVEVLEKLLNKHEIIRQILDYRMLSKLKSTYVEGLLPLINKDNKIHPHFQQTVASTGRISCTDPNLQNIPIKQEYGRRIRRAFVTSSADFSLVGADYSQIELRVLAHLSEDPLLIEAFNNGDDIHKITASKVFGIPENEVTSLQRNNAKVVNFGVIYGMSGFGLSTELKISRKDAENYITEYFKKYKKVKIYMDSMIEIAKAQGYVTTILNRKRTINEINASNFMVRQAGERLAMNSPIQGSAADIIKLAMIKVYSELLKNKTKSKLILQVHDELIIEAHYDEQEAMKKLIENCMESAMILKVKLAVDVNCGKSWYELK